MEQPKILQKASISTQIFSARKSNDQRLTGSQCKRYDYVDINYFIGPKFQRKRCRHTGIVLECRQATAWGGGLTKTHGWSSLLQILVNRAVSKQNFTTFGQMLQFKIQ